MHSAVECSAGKEGGRHSRPYGDSLCPRLPGGLPVIPSRERPAQPALRRYGALPQAPGAVLFESSTHDGFHGAFAPFKHRTRQTTTAPTISSTVAPRDKSLIGFLKPCRLGPIA